MNKILSIIINGERVIHKRILFPKTLEHIRRIEITIHDDFYPPVFDYNNCDGDDNDDNAQLCGNLGLCHDAYNRNPSNSRLHFYDIGRMFETRKPVGCSGNHQFNREVYQMTRR